MLLRNLCIIHVAIVANLEKKLKRPEIKTIDCSKNIIHAKYRGTKETQIYLSRSKAMLINSINLEYIEK